MKRNILIGGAWPYGNYFMHIGHLSALLPGDIIARYYRLKGDNVIYVSGTDCHGTPITERAKKEEKTPKEISDYYHDEFFKTFNKIGFSYDLYTKTSSEYHKEKVKEYFKIIYKNGYIYEKEEDSDYCSKCNKFLSDREIVGTCPRCGGEATGDQCELCLASLNSNEVLNKHCKTCKNNTTTKLNKHLYFKLSAFENSLKEYILNNKDIWRKNAYGEALKFIDMGLIDRAATRDLTWGIDVPIEGYEDKKIYVWIEAVLGYLTASQKICEEKGIEFRKFITDKNLTSYYVHGKDNVTFHTIIYPALLLALDKDYNLPNYIVSSEYVNLNDEKMSKSKGNLLTANELLEIYDVDTIRYYIIANGPEKKDVNFTFDDINRNHNKFLVGVLGNFINRNFSFIKNKFDGYLEKGTIDNEIKKITISKYKEIGELIEKAELKSAIESIFEYISLGNKYYDQNEPWIKVKDDFEKFKDISYTCNYMIANISNFLNPFMPSTSEKIRKMIGITSTNWEEIVPNIDININQIELLFERIKEK